MGGMDVSWHTQPLEQVFSQLQTSQEGLSSSLAKERLQSHGPNRLSGKERFSWMRLLLRQILTPFVFILILATIVKYFTSGWVDGSVILMTIVVMVLIGFLQEMKAEKTLAALKNLAAQRSKVKRDGAWQEILSDDLVPGDVILLETGDKVPADSRLIHVSNLKVDESMLTGESIPLTKGIEALEEKTPLAERRNMIYSSTVVVYGKAEAVVISTAMQTEVGKIATSIQEIATEPTPLEKDLHSIGRWMIVIILAASVFFAMLGLYAGMSIIDVFLLSVAAMVSAIPEGLPAAFAVTLAVGMRLMSRKNAIVRKMSAVETLGSTTVICSDKTGTLTRNQMTVVSLYVAGETLFLGNGHEQCQKSENCKLALEIGALCNDARIVKKEGREFFGDPTETSLLAAAIQERRDPEALNAAQPRIAEIPFTSETFYMATLHKVGEKAVVYLKGAPEKVLSLCSQVRLADQAAALDEGKRNEIEKVIHEMTKSALRLIAVAYVDVEAQTSQMKEDLFAGKLIFVGLFGIIDPPRKEVMGSISLCKKAGVRVIMITGDNPLTAEAIAKQLEIPANGVVAGKELSEANEEQLRKIVQETSIFARVEPSQKFRIVQALQKSGHIVAMTGDGINDAPALEAANIGIAMGLSGSDVAKEAADMVLTDDRFDSIVAAIEEGRAIFNRLRNICALLIATCFGEMISLILCVAFLGLAPLIPSQILWINLIAGSLVAIPLGLEPKTGQEMAVPPRDPKSRLIYRGMLYRILMFSALLGLGAFFLFDYLILTTSLEKARSMIFTAVIVFEWVAALEMRSDEIPSRKLSLMRNMQLLTVLLIVIAVHLSILYVPSFRFLFQTIPLTLSEWVLVLIPAGGILAIESLRKEFFPRLFNKGKWKKGK